MRSSIQKLITRRRSRQFFTAAIAVALLAMPAALDARAGGGEGFSGGGGGGGGGGWGGGGGGWGGGGGFGGGGYHYYGGGGGGGGIDGFGLLIIFVAVIVIMAFRFWQWQQQQGGGGSLSVSPGLPDQYQQTRMLQELRFRDPAFDATAFGQRVRLAFVALQDAWCGQDLSRVRPFISDSVHERFSLQFNEQKAQGYHDHMDNLEVFGVRLAQVSCDESFDAVTVRIVARANDYPASLADGHRMPGPSSFGTFSEYWTFLRRRGAQTAPGKPGLMEGQCPNCGAPVEMNQSAICTSCKALLRSGQYDWVLTEITQESEWHNVPGFYHEPGGFREIRRRDPGFNVQALEDRASVIFWRRAEAWRTGKIAPLQKAALPGFAEEIVQTLAPPATGPRQYFGQCAVGSVNALGVIPAHNADAGDRAILRIVWSAQRWLVRPDGTHAAASPEYHTFRTLMVLFRKPGVKSDAGLAVSSAHCPNCGAPETDSASNACEFCGTVLNDGSVSWVLMSTHAQASGDGQQVLQQLANASAAMA